MTAQSLLARSLEEHLAATQALLETKLSEIEATGQLICRTLASGNKVLICGNGGSAADAQHIAAELVGRYEQHRRAWPAIALTTDTSALTAVSNDYGYAEVFARQVEALAVANDLLIAISTSGESANVIRAAITARERGCKVIGLTGANGGKLSESCDLTLSVPSDRTARVQELHITIGHLWCEQIERIADCELRIADFP
jgi:D-sedoheptulose 7-phosphate isomerase